MCWACGDVFTQASSSSSPRNSSPASVISQAWSPQPVPLIATIETEIQGTRDGSLGFRPWWVCREAEQHRTFLCLFPRGGRLPVSVHAKLASPKVMWVNVAPQTVAFLPLNSSAVPFWGEQYAFPSHTMHFLIVTRDGVCRWLGDTPVASQASLCSSQSYKADYTQLRATEFFPASGLEAAS